MKYLAFVLVALLSACGGDNQDMFRYEPGLIVNFVVDSSTL